MNPATSLSQVIHFSKLKAQNSKLKTQNSKPGIANIREQNIHTRITELKKTPLAGRCFHTFSSTDVPWNVSPATYNTTFFQPSDFSLQNIMIQSAEA